MSAGNANADMEELMDDRAQLVVSELLKKVTTVIYYTIMYCSPKPLFCICFRLFQLKRANDHRDELNGDVSRLTRQIEDISMSKIKVRLFVCLFVCCTTLQMLSCLVLHILSFAAYIYVSISIPMFPVYYRIVFE
jgi:hypothetical protein